MDLLLVWFMSIGELLFFGVQTMDLLLVSVGEILFFIVAGTTDLLLGSISADELFFVAATMDLLFVGSTGELLFLSALEETEVTIDLLLGITSPGTLLLFFSEETESLFLEAKGDLFFGDKSPNLANSCFLPTARLSRKLSANLTYSVVVLCLLCSFFLFG